MQRGTVLIRVYVESRDQLGQIKEERTRDPNGTSGRWYGRRSESIADVLEAILKERAAAPGVDNNRRIRAKVVNKRARR